MTDGSNLATGPGGVQRWDLVGGIWTKSYTFTNMPASASGNNGPTGLAVDFTAFTGGGTAGTGAIVYATTGQGTLNSLGRIVDNGPSLAPLTVLSTAGVNQVMRGLRFAPVADPVSIVAQPAN